MLRWVSACVGLVLSAMPAASNELLDQLTTVMRLDDVASILRQEGLEHGRNLDADMLGNSGGAYFTSGVSDIYSTDRIKQTIHDALADNMSAEQMQESAVFFASDLGQTIISLENSARQAYADPVIEEMAVERWAALGNDAPRRVLIEEYVAVNDLIERNVDGTLSSDFSFFKGVASVRGVIRDDQMLLAELWEQRDTVRTETEAWIYGFLLMAYQPLSDQEMRENIDFSATDTGQVLNDALFHGFRRLYDEIYFDLGQAVAQAMFASEL
ncbi:MAG: DUF2059 domain-containing protein [Pseudomonadota bacterium]